MQRAAFRDSSPLRSPNISLINGATLNPTSGWTGLAFGAGPGLVDAVDAKGRFVKVKAAIARHRGSPLAIEALELDEPRADEILVRLIASGVSGADLDAIDGRLAMPLPFVPGCEGAGIVERVGADVTHVGAGDAVVVGFAFCSHCENCVAGRPWACVDFAALNLSGRRLDGSTPFSEASWDVNGSFFGQSSFATHLICRAASAVAVAGDAPLELLACLGGEILLGAGTVLHGFRPQSDDPLLVVGAGAMGLAAVMAAKARGVDIVIVADADESRRALASELGATVTVHPDEGFADLVRSVAADGVRFGLETTGEPDARRACLDGLAVGGTCAMITPPEGERIDFDDQAAEGDRLILSVDGHAPPSILIPELVRLRAQGQFPLEQLVDFFPFERVNDAIEALRGRRAVQPIVRFRLGAFDDLDRAKTAGAGNEAPGEGAPEDPAERDRPEVLVKS